MSAETDQRAESLFCDAIELPADARDGFLDNACGADAGLRAEVDELLRLHGEAAGFLPEDAATSPDLESHFGRSKPEQVGDRIGPYKLLEQIGEGGFGTVWVAEQEKPMRRRVALKIIKLGMDTKEVIARFEQERQALAMMEHPNIARVLDAGATPLGRPYFVMELVRGVKITEYCDRANLPTAERLRLFVAVCHAVQHAHQKGIIHRDLKPSNILVTMHDGVPVAKVIDFGVAKATQQQRLTDLTIYTQFEQMVGTPLYMSPEQAEMTGLDIDTRSDIYSLGVLLYELLVGRTPFDPESLMKRGLDEIRRAVREQEPQKPSTFVSTMAVDLRTNLALRRQTESARLIGQIRGDLDWIVMKALEKDRARRYETATGLAQDIQRHLLSEPVQARPASNLYRFRRFAKRNKVGFAAASAVLAALIIGLGVSTWMFFKEKHARGRAIAAEQEQVRLRELSVAAEKAQSEERIKAETEASKSRQVAQFLTDMLDGVGPAVALGRDTKMLQEILDKTAERVGSDLKDQPAVEADLRSIIGEVYCALGDYVKAGAMHTEALAMRKKLLGNEHPDVGASLNSLAQVLLKQGNLAEAETMHREVLATHGKLLGNENPNVAILLNTLATVLTVQDKLAEAEPVYREALAMQRKLLGNEHPAVAVSLNNLAGLLGTQGKLAEAETMHREALAMRRKLLGGEHPDVANSLNNLAQVLGTQGKLAEAETMHREALAMYRKLLGNEHPDVASSLNNLAVVLDDQDKLAEAETMFREVLAMHRKRLGSEHPVIAASLNNLAVVLGEQGKLAEAETMFREALAMHRKRLGNEHPVIANSLNNLAQVLGTQDKLAEAETMHREALAMQRKLLGNEHADVAASLNSLSRALFKQGKLAEAETMSREVLAMHRKLLGNEHPVIANSLNSLAVVLDHQDKLAEAETMHREALAMQRKLLGNEHADVAASLNSLARALFKQGKLAEAETMSREALAMQRKLLGNEHPHVATSLNSLAVVLGEQGKLAEAETMSREALAMQRKPLGNEHPDVANSLSTLAYVLRKQGKLAEAETMSREALAMQRKLLGNEHPEVATALNNLAAVLSLSEQDKLAEAEPMYREALAMRRKLLGNEHPVIANSLNSLAVVLGKQGKLAEAETMSREVLAMRRKLLGNEHPVIANSLNSLALVLGEQGKLAEAETMSREALAMKRKLLGNEHPAVADALKNLASLLRDQGRLTEIEPLYREALAIARKSAASDPPGLDVRLIDLAEYLFRQSKYAEAEQLYREVIKSQQVRLAAEDNKILGTTASLGRLLADWAWSERSTISEIQNTKSKITERAGEAEHLLRDCLAIRLRGTEATHWRTTGEAPSRLGGALLAVAVTDPALTSGARLAKFTEAESLLLQGNEVLQQDEKVDSKYQRDSFTRLVRLYDAWAKADKAAAWQQKLNDFEAKIEARNEAVSPGP